MKARDIAEGILILTKYYDNQFGHHCAAYDEVIYMCSIDKPISSEDVIKLKHLGWFQEGIIDPDGEVTSNYFADEPWQAIV